MANWPELGFAVLAAVALTSCSAGSGSGNSSAAPSPDAALLIQGSIVLAAGNLDWWEEGKPCRGKGGYADLVGGAQIVVENETGTTIAVGQLEPGTLPDPIPTDPWTSRRVPDCTFQFSVKDVPEGANFYTLKIGSRESPTFTREQLDAPLELSIG